MPKPTSTVDYFKRIGTTAGNQGKLQDLKDIYGKKNVDVDEKNGVLSITTGTGARQQVQGVWAGTNLRSIMEEMGLMKDWEFCRGGDPRATSKQS